MIKVHLKTKITTFPEHLKKILKDNGSLNNLPFFTTRRVSAL